MNIKRDVTQLIGNTPLIDVSNNDSVKVYAKLEMFNPGGSVKDRIALNMIETAEGEGILKPDSIIVEATSGNTGIGLAAVGASKGYEVKIVLPDSLTVERRNMIKSYGAQLILTPGEFGMKGAIAKALELQQEDPRVFIPSQFENNANLLAHYEKTGPEIWQDTDGTVDVFVAGVGTGGTISGVGRYLKQQNPQIEVIAIEPSASAVLSGSQPGKHAIQGIGAGFVPTILDQSVIDRIETVTDQQAKDMVRYLSKKHGISVGISSGAALAVAYRLAQQEQYRNKTIVTVLPDNGDRYLSLSLFD